MDLFDLRDLFDIFDLLDFFDLIDLFDLFNRFELDNKEFLNTEFFFNKSLAARLNIVSFKLEFFLRNVMFSIILVIDAFKLMLMLLFILFIFSLNSIIFWGCS